MTRSHSRRPAPCSGLDLVEQAAHLLRQSPTALVLHCAGAVPFAVGLLYFWTDMSRGAFADRRCASGALALSALFLWMKTWQTVFARSLLADLSGESAPRWTLRRLARVVMIHATIQPTAFLTLPIAAVLTVPFVWTHAFYQNLAVVADDPSGSIRASTAKAWRLARLWTGQNHLALSATWLFGLFVFLNVLVTLWLAPHLVKMLFGVETDFTRAGNWMFSSTTFAAAAVLTWLLVSPLTRAVSVLRCFYGESLQTGQDLLSELRSLVALGAMLVVFFFGTPMLRAEPVSPTRPTMTAEELDRSIERVLQQTRYTWRFPRERSAQTDQPGWFSQLARDVADTIKSRLHAWHSQVRKWLRWLEERFGPKPPDWTAQRDPHWTESVRALLYGLLGLAAGLLLLVLWREWRRGRRQSEAALQPDMAHPTPDVADETVAASALPEEEWLARARELGSRGEFRLALRALYLAMLAHLGRRELITIARHKSNCEYERELARRARLQTELLAAFAQNRLLFEDTWYGLHEATAAKLDRFQANLERIRHDAGPR